jgi:hypothetical protein
MNVSHNIKRNSKGSFIALGEREFGHYSFFKEHFSNAIRHFMRVGTTLLASPSTKHGESNCNNLGKYDDEQEERSMEIYVEGGKTRRFSSRRLFYVLLSVARLHTRGMFFLLLFY